MIHWSPSTDPWELLASMSKMAGSRKTKIRKGDSKWYSRNAGGLEVRDKIPPMRVILDESVGMARLTMG
jgi:hypothetical protein